MRRRKHEEELNHEAWAIPYGDLVTLLLAFFVVMYAMSSVNEGKYRILADALSAEFRGVPRSPEPIQIGAQPRAAPVDEKMPPAEKPEAAAQRSEPKTEERIPPPTTPAEDMAGNATELNRVADDVEQAMANLIREQLVAVRRHGLWIEVEIKADVLFPSGVATLSPLAVSTLAPLADALKPFPNPLRVEGHTDNQPISTREFKSNWELSAARAANVVHLFSERGVQSTRLTVIGLGEHRPLKSNASADGRSANRRVVIVVLGSEGLPQGTHGFGGATEPTAP